MTGDPALYPSGYLYLHPDRNPFQGINDYGNAPSQFNAFLMEPYIKALNDHTAALNRLAAAMEKQEQNK